MTSVAEITHDDYLHDDNYVGTHKDSRNDGSVINPGAKNLCTQICKGKKKKICSKTLLVSIKHKNKSKIIKGYVIIDEQSSSSFIDPSVIDMLNVPFSSHNYTLRTLTGYSTEVKGKRVDGLMVQGIKEKKWFFYLRYLQISLFLIPEMKWLVHQ